MKEDVKPVSPKGQVVIPKHVRELLKVKDGGDVIFRVLNGVVTLESAAEIRKQQIGHFLQTMSELSSKVSDEWQDNIGAVEAVAEQRR